MREAALVGMVDGVLAELKSYPDSTGVVNVRRYIERALFPFAMTQVIHPSPQSISVKVGFRVHELRCIPQ